MIYEFFEKLKASTKGYATLDYELLDDRPGDLKRLDVKIIGEIVDALSIIVQAKKACSNDLNKIKSCIKLTGFVNSTDNFIEQPKVINGASDLITSVFGDLGMHTRAAVSTNSLPLGVAVEVDTIFELK